MYIKKKKAKHYFHFSRLTELLISIVKINHCFKQISFFKNKEWEKTKITSIGTMVFYLVC